MERRQIVERLKAAAAEIEDGDHNYNEQPERHQPSQQNTIAPEAKFTQPRVQTMRELEQKDRPGRKGYRRSTRLTSPDPSPRLLSPTRASAARAEVVAAHLASLGMGAEWIDAPPGVGHYAPKHQTDLSEVTRPNRSQQGSFSKSEDIEIGSSGHYIVTGKLRPVSPEQDGLASVSIPQPHSLVRTKSDIAKHVSKLHSWDQQTKCKKEELTETHHASFATKHKQVLESSFHSKLGLSNEGGQAAAMKSLAQPTDRTREQEIAEQQVSSLPFTPQLDASFAAKGIGQSTPAQGDQEDEASGRKAGRGGQGALSERLSSPRRVSAMAHDKWAPDQVTRRVCIHVSPSDPVGTMCRFCQPSAISDHNSLYDDQHNITVGHAGHLSWSMDHDGHVNEIMEKTRSFSTKGAGEQHVVDLHGHETASRKQRPHQTQEEMQAFNARELSEKELKSLLQRVRGGKLPKCAATSDLRAKQAKEVSAIKSSGEDYLALRLHSTHQTMLEKLDSARKALKQREEASTSFVPKLSPGSRRMMSPRKEHAPLAASSHAKTSEESSMADVAAVARELEVGLAVELDELEALEAAELASMEMAATQEADEVHTTDAAVAELVEVKTTAKSNVITVTCPEGSQSGSVIMVEMDGLEIEVEIPEGVVPGGAFDIEFDDGSDEDDETPTAPDSTTVDALSSLASTEQNAAIVVQRQWRGYRVRARPALPKTSPKISNTDEIEPANDSIGQLLGPHNSNSRMTAHGIDIPASAKDRRASLVLASNRIEGLEAMFSQLKDDLAGPGSITAATTSGGTGTQQPTEPANVSPKKEELVFSELAGILDASTDDDSSSGSDDSSLDLQSLGVKDVM
eukprot:COSAG02_NODE_184_length_30545_cov_128.634402_12_plen_853_part_00